MTARRCQTMPLVEARRDGRLADRERASLERHLESCASCRAFDADLARLADLARAPGPAASRLEHTRGRMHLLQAAAVLEGPAAGPADRGTLGGISAAPPPARAGWRAPLAAALVALTIAAAGASRSRVAAATSGGGDTAPPVTEAPPPVAEAPPSVEAAPVARPAETARAEAATSAAARLPAVAKHGTASGKRAPVGAATAKEREDDLAAGVGSLARGDFGEAAERLRAFQEKHPGDARAEDAAFLRVLALDRAGKHEAAEAAARAYLERYPKGYRRAEAEAILAKGD